MTHTWDVADMSKDARASWRRFWRNGPTGITPRQVADEAYTRVEEARARADSPLEERLAVDPYDLYLVEQGTDPLTVQQARARRVEIKQTEKKRRRRADRQQRGK